MNKANFFKITAGFLVVFGLIGCSQKSDLISSQQSNVPDSQTITQTSSTTETTANPDKQFTEDEVLKLVNDVIQKTLTDFSITQYNYQYNKITNQVLNNKKTNTVFHSFTKGFEAEQTNEKGEGTYEDFTPTSKNSGILSSYPSDDPSYFVYGYKANEGGNEDNFYNELEVNKWQDASKTLDNNIKLIFDDIAKGTTGEGFWTSQNGYALDSYTEIIDGNYVFKRYAQITATQEDLQMGYADEENYVEYTISPTFALLSYTYHTKIYNTNFASGINGETYIHLDNMKFGEKVAKQNISKITDLSIVPETNILLSSKKVDVPKGDISQDIVLDLFKNLPYYSLGTKSSHNEYSIDEFDSTGSSYKSSVIEDSTRYQDYITIKKRQKTNQSTLVKTLEEDQIVGKDTRVEATHSKDGQLSYDPPIDTYALGFKSEASFNPSGYYPLSVFFSEAKKFGEENNGISITTRTLNSATNNNGTISIDWSLDSTYTIANIPETHKNFKIAIENGFLSKIEVYDKDTNNQYVLTESYNMTKGDYDKYEGETLPYVEPEQSVL